MANLELIACGDDYLLDEAVTSAVSAMCADLGVGEPQVLGEDATPETAAIELCSPSLFDPTRVLVVPDARAWVSAPAPAGASGRLARTDVAPLVRALADGVPENVGLVLAVWCGGRPKGELVDLVSEHGEVRWIPLPPQPKPWEDVTLSDEQRAVLERVLERAAPQARFAPAARRLLLDRLGFAPRLLAQEAVKLATAAGDAEVDDALVRRLTFPRERSLEVVRDAVLERNGAPLFDLLADAAEGVPIQDWRGQRLDGGSVPLILVGQVAGLLEQLLYLRRAATDLHAEMAPSETGRRGWYQRRFKGELAPELSRRLEADPHCCLTRAGKLPTAWTLGQLFAAAGRWRNDDLLVALEGAGAVEARLRGGVGLEALSAWLARAFGGV